MFASDSATRRTCCYLGRRDFEMRAGAAPWESHVANTRMLCEADWKLLCVKAAADVVS